MEVWLAKDDGPDVDTGLGGGGGGATEDEA